MPFKKNPFLCGVCRKGFKDKTALEEHLPKHRRGKKNFKCSICELSYSTQEALNNHLEKHADGSVVLLECGKCDIAFRTKSDLQSHIVNEHYWQKVGVKKKGPVECQICKKVLAGEHRLKPHMMVAHSDEKPFACESCGESFKYKIQLEKHVRTHTGEDPYKCSTCGKSFATKKTLRDHIMTHTGEKNFHCEECGKGFIKAADLTKHKYSRHTKNEDLPFACSYCSKRFPEKRHMQEHMLSHSDAKPFVCDTCGKAFARKRNLDRHNMMHTDERPFQCTICGNRFRERRYVKEHMLTHDKNRERLYQCELCGQKCINAQTLKSHMRIHDEDKRHKCHLCTATFSYSDGLKNHLVKHSGKMPHKCVICHRRFLVERALKKHMKTHKDKQNSARPFVCKVCQDHFARMDELIDHMKNEHSGDRPYQCKQCGLTFKRGPALSRHRLVHTGEKPYGCNVCGKRFTAKYKLKNHFSTHPGAEDILAHQLAVFDEKREESKPQVEKPFKCTECSYKTSRNADLKYHLMIHTGERPHQCELCGAGFITRYKLKYHMKDKHGVSHQVFEEQMSPDISRYKKPILIQNVKAQNQQVVQITTAQNDTLQIEEIIGPDTTEQCDQCGAGFSQRYQLKSHMKQQHGVSDEVFEEHGLLLDTTLQNEQVIVESTAAQDEQLVQIITEQEEHIVADMTVQVEEIIVPHTTEQIVIDGTTVQNKQMVPESTVQIKHITIPETTAQNEQSVFQVEEDTTEQGEGRVLEDLDTAQVISTDTSMCHSNVRSIDVMSEKEDQGNDSETDRYDEDDYSGLDDDVLGADADLVDTNKDAPKPDAGGHFDITNEDTPKPDVSFKEEHNSHPKDKPSEQDMVSTLLNVKEENIDLVIKDEIVGSDEMEHSPVSPSRFTVKREEPSELSKSQLSSRLPTCYVIIPKHESNLAQRLTSNDFFKVNTNSFAATGRATRLNTSTTSTRCPPCYVVIPRHESALSRSALTSKGGMKVEQESKKGGGKATRNAKGEHERSKDEVKCSTCGKAFTSQDQLLNHLMEDMQNVLMKCKICGKVCASVKLLEEHNVTHGDDTLSDDKVDTGGNCYLSMFVQSDDDGSDEDIEHDDSKISAGENLHDKEKKEYTGQDARVADIVINKKVAYFCRVCSLIFHEKSAVTEHIKTHGVQTMYKCTHCEKILTTHEDLKRHNMTHDRNDGKKLNSHSEIAHQHKPETNNDFDTVEKVLQCEVCQLKFSTGSSLMMHMQTMHSGKNVLLKCTKCGKGYPSMFALKMHEMVHEGKEEVNKSEGASPVSCDNDVVDDSTSMDEIVNDYNKADENTEKLKCTRCGKEYPSEFALKMHKMMHESEDSDDDNFDADFDKENTGILLLKCAKCGEGFPTRNELNEHEMSHTREDSDRSEQDNSTYSNVNVNGDFVQKNKSDITKMSVENSQKSVTKAASGSQTVRGLLYKCPKCPAKVFQTLNVLRSHVVVEHTYKSRRGRKKQPKKIIKCEICGKQLKFAAQLKIHMRIHNGEKPYICKFCGESFRHKERLQRHVREHTGEKPYQCKTCGKVCATPATLRDHEMIHTGEKPHKCSKCGKGFRKVADLKKHDNSVHTSNDKKPFQCSLCSKGYSERRNLEEHLLTHTGERPFVCDTCGKGFARKKTLNRHKMMHTDERPCQCNFCGKAFRERSGLKYHLKIHTGEPRRKPYQCELCGQGCVTPSSLRNHMKIHSDEKPFHCDECGMAFRYKDSLKYHLMGHSNERPFKCTTCDKSFDRMSKLKQHETTHNDVKPHSCETCGKTFHTTIGLKAHLIAHTDERPFPCTTCDMAFKTKTRLRLHMKSHTDVKAFQCHLCAQWYKSLSTLRAHILTHSVGTPFTCTLCNKSFKLESYLKIHLKTQAHRS